MTSVKKCLQFVLITVSVWQVACGNPAEWFDPEDKAPQKANEIFVADYSGQAIHQALYAGHRAEEAVRHLQVGLEKKLKTKACQRLNDTTTPEGIRYLSVTSRCKHRRTGVHVTVAAEESYQMLYSKTEADPRLEVISYESDMYKVDITRKNKKGKPVQRFTGEAHLNEVRNFKAVYFGDQDDDSQGPLRAYRVNYTVSIEDYEQEVKDGAFVGMDGMTDTDEEKRDPNFHKVVVMANALVSAKEGRVVALSELTVSLSNSSTRKVYKNIEGKRDHQLLFSSTEVINLNMRETKETQLLVKEKCGVIEGSFQLKNYRATGRTSKNAKGTIDARDARWRLNVKNPSKKQEPFQTMASQGCAKVPALENRVDYGLVFIQ